MILLEVFLIVCGLVQKLIVNFTRLQVYFQNPSYLPMKRVAVDLHYLPSLEFFAAIADAEELLIFPKDIYQRQSYLNRTRIRLANKVEVLSVPIVGRRPKLPMDQIRIDYSQKWQSVHLRGIQSAYGKAPFFEYYFPYFHEIFEMQEESLWVLNQKLLTICLKILRWPDR